MAKVKIGIIGLDHWYWALGFAYGIALNPNAELIAISDVNEEKASRIAKVYGAKSWYTNYHKLLENPEIDAVTVTTTTSMHCEVAVNAAEAGKNVLVGKPVSRTLKEADKIIDACRKNDVKLMAIAAGRPQEDDMVKKRLDEGIIGSPIAAQASILAIIAFREPGVPEPGWFADPMKAAGGAFIDHAIYHAGALRYYLNSEVESVYARMGRFIYKDLDVEDYGFAILNFKNGTIGIIESSWTAPIRSHHDFHIIGTEGEMRLDDAFLYIWSKKEPYKNIRVIIEPIPLPPVYETTYVEKPIPTPPYAAGYKPVIDEFIECCLIDEKKPLQTGEDARRALEICLAAYESAGEGKPVNLPLKKEVNVPEMLKKI